LPPVTGNPFELQQVLLNLVNNSIDAMIPVRDGERRISISVRRPQDDLEVAVADTGPGLSEEARERLFAPFFTTKEQGTGLGLAISMTVIRSHGGTLRFRDAPRGGACFYFSLPVERERKP
jgi:signal transduction histidine kinase